MTSPYDPNAGYGSQPNPAGQPPYGQPTGGQPGYPPPDAYGQSDPYGQPDPYGQSQPDQYGQPQYYPVDQPPEQSYPTSGQAYPASGPAYPASGPGYPGAAPGGYQQGGYPPGPMGPGGPGGQPPGSGGNGKGLLIGGLIGGGALIFIVVVVLVVVAVAKSGSNDEEPTPRAAGHSAAASDEASPTPEDSDSPEANDQPAGGSYTAPSSLCDAADFAAWKDGYGDSNIDPNDNKSGTNPTIEVCVWLLGDYGSKNAMVSYTAFFEKDDEGATRMYNYYHGNSSGSDPDAEPDAAKSGTVKSISGVGTKAFAYVNDNVSNDDKTEVDIFVLDGNLLLKEDVTLADNGSAPSSSAVDKAYDNLKTTAGHTLDKLG